MPRYNTFTPALPDPLGDVLAACYRRILSQIDVEGDQKKTPINSYALDGDELIGTSGQGAKPQPRETLPHAT